MDARKVSRILALIAVILFLAMVAVIVDAHGQELPVEMVAGIVDAHGQELPAAPSEQRRIMWDFKASWSTWAMTMTTDGLMSQRWAGQGLRPCAWEGNPMFARSDGTFKTGKYFVTNGLIGGGLFAINLAIRKKAPVRIANHWAVRALGDFFPVMRTQQHARNIISWARFCG